MVRGGEEGKKHCCMAIAMNLPILFAKIANIATYNVQILATRLGEGDRGGGVVPGL